MAVRAASHSGSWYDSSPATLGAQLDCFLGGADVAASRVRAVIAPHAGYSYSGPTAAFAYKSVDTRGMCVELCGSHAPCCAVADAAWQHTVSACSSWGPPTTGTPAGAPSPPPPCTKRL